MPDRRTTTANGQGREALQVNQLPPPLPAIIYYLLDVQDLVPRCPSGSLEFHWRLGEAGKAESMKASLKLNSH